MFIIIFSCNQQVEAEDKSKALNSVEIAGLSSLTEREFLFLMGLSGNEMPTSKEIKEGIKRAFRKGFFDDIIVQDKGDASTLLIIVREKPFIKSVNITGNEQISERLIRKLLSIGEGERFSRHKLNMSAAALNKGLHEIGYPKASVMFQVIQDKDNTVNVIFDVKEGSPDLISRVTISEPDDTIKNLLRFVPGDVFDRTEMERLKKKTLRHYQELGYIGTDMSYGYASGELDIRLTTGRRVEVSFSGNNEVSSTLISSELSLSEIRDVSDELVEETTARIVSLYHKLGYPYAQVAPLLSWSDDAVLITYYVFEGQRQSIESVVFEGASLGMERLSAILLMGVGDYYNPDRLDADAESLREFYRSLGYLYAEVSGPYMEPQGNGVSLKYSIKEGIQVLVESLSMLNNTYIPTEDLFREIELKPGAPYNEIDISEARRKVIEVYNKNGFLDAKVSADVSVEDAVARIVFTVSEGKRFFFGRHIVTGNDKTKVGIIERQLVHKEGAPVDYSLVLKERQRMYRTGLFTDIEVEMIDGEDSKKDLLYRLKEAPAGIVEFGFGYGEYEKQRGFLEVGYKNIGGMNRQGSFRTELSTLEQRLMLSYSEPWFADSDLSLKALVTHETRKEKSIDNNEIKYRLRRDSASVGIERKYGDKMKAELFYDFSVVRTSDVKPDIVLSKEDTGSLIISSLRPGLMFDTRDNPFDPKSGLLAGLSLKTTSALLFSETNFVKLIIFVNKYYSISRKFVLAASLRWGAAKGYGNTRELPVVERFFLGGRNTVRGYAQDTLGPKGEDGTPTGGNSFASGNLEVRMTLKKDFGLVVFLDGGNVWQKIENADVSSLRYSSGVGFRYNTPVGPFRIDYGYKISPQEGESKGELHFSLGHAF